MGQSAKSSFVFPENRLRLAWLIRKSGFSVRIHGYEYLIAYENRFLCLILLQPTDKTILVKEFKWLNEPRKLVEKIVELIRTMDEVSKIIVY
ncbi:MAG: hypothetical protein QW304_03995 [Thermoproteota archaeon]